MNAARCVCVCVCVQLMLRTHGEGFTVAVMGGCALGLVFIQKRAQSRLVMLHGFALSRGLQAAPAPEGTISPE